MIRSRLKLLRVQAEERQGRKLTYRTIASETGLAIATISRLMTNEFDRVDTHTLDRLCTYFACQVGDLLVHVPEE